MPITEAARLVAALLGLYGHMAHGARACILAERERVVASIELSVAQAGTPAGLVLAVAFLESHLGCDPASGGCWGSPADRRHRHTAGSPLRAAADLAASHTVCGTWLRGVSRFRMGLCAWPARHPGYTPLDAIHLTRALYLYAGVPVPELGWSR